MYGAVFLLSIPFGIYHKCVCKIRSQIIASQSLLGFIFRLISNSLANSIISQSLLGFIIWRHSRQFKKRNSLSIPFGIYRVTLALHRNGHCTHSQSLLGFIPNTKYIAVVITSNISQSLLGFIKYVLNCR